MLLPTLAGCGMVPRKPLVPMPQHPALQPCARPVNDLLVMLPGAYSAPQDFVTEGLVGELATRGIAADVLLADTHLGYYAERTVLQRLRADVIGPARQARQARLAHPAAGQDTASLPRIWLVGISLGGLIALAYAMQHADEVAGAVLLSPYPGRRALQQAILGAGGPAAWIRQSPQADLPGDLDFAAWAGLAGRAPQALPPVYISYGRGDRFATGQALMASLLPPDQAQATDGDHDWDTWRSLWRAWLDRDLLPRRCPGTA